MRHIYSNLGTISIEALKTVLNCASGIGKVAIVILFFLSYRNVANGQCTSTVYYDNMETFTWFGDWYLYNYSNFYTNISVSPTVSAAHYGVGTSSSGIEQDWYVLPNITGLNPAYTYKVKFRLASTLLTGSTAATRGVDVADFIEVQLSTNGGVSYSSEIRILGNSNAQWNYSATGVAAKTANGTLTQFTTPTGSQYALRPGGYSTVELTLPVGSTQCAVDIYNRVNSAGEDFWIDNVELIEIIPQPTLSIAGNTPICSGGSLTLTASGAQTYSWDNGISNGVPFNPTSSSTYTVTGTNTGMVNGTGSTNSCTATANVSVTVQSPPTAPTSISGTNTICSGQSTTLTAAGGSNGSGATFQWGTGTVGSNVIAGQTSATLTVSPTVTTTYWVRRVGNTTCTGSTGGTSATVTVTPSSTAPTLSGTSPVCPTISVVLNATGGTASPGSTISWYSGPNGTGSFLGFGNSYTVAPTATSTYYARREGGCNTTADGTYTITVNNPTLATPPAASDMVWRGASNTDWATLGNWWQFNGTGYAAASAAPTTAQNVIIPANQACVLNQPNTNANAGNAKNLRIESGAILTMGNGTLTVAENWVNNGTFTPGTGTIEFTGSGTHTVSGISGAHNFHNLTLNKDGEVQLSVPIAMSGALTLSIGRLDIGNSNLDLASNTVNGGNANSYVRTSGTGVLMRNVGASMVEFPVGRVAYNPASIANAGALDKFNVRVIDNVTEDGTAVGTPTTQAVVNRTWMVNEENSGGSNVTLRLHWNGAGEQINGFSPADGFIAHYLASEGLWDNIGFTAVGAGYFETNNITSFSPFTISSSGSFAPLPVELIAFTAHCQNEDVAVNWSTASEHNSQYFALQVSEDGYSWSDLYVIEAAEFSTSLLEYAYIHKNAARTKNYYRLRQVDNDGTVETYNTILSNCTSDENVFMTFPNPSADAFTVLVNDKQLSGANVLNISDASGKLIYSIAVDLENGSGSFAIEGLDMPAGLYYLQLNNGSYASRIIKHSFR